MLQNLFGTVLVYEMRTATETLASQQMAAKKGDPKAIATILQTRLQAYAITPKVGLRQQDNLLYIALEATQATDPKMVLPLVKAALLALEMPWLNLVQVSGRLVGQVTPLWQQELTLRPIPNLGPMPSSPMAAKINVGGDFSGQLIVGNNNNQTFYSYSYNVEHGGILNVAAPPQIATRHTPINLRPQPFNGLLDRKDILPQLAQALQISQPIELYAEDGFGKTALLRHLMYDAQATARFSDGVVYTPAHRLLPADLLQALYDAFYESNVPHKPSYTQVQHALQSKQALIVLEDLGLEKADLAPLLAVLPHGTFVLTSSQRSFWGDGVAIELPGLPLDDSFKLMERELGRRLTPTEDPVARALCQTLQGHPLQLRRIAAHVKQNQQPLTTFILPKAVSAHTDVQAAPQTTVFHTIAGNLSKSHHQVLAMLGALGGLALTPEQALAISQVANAESVLNELHALHLVSTGPNGYYLCSDLVNVCQQTWPVETWLTAAVEYFTAGHGATGSTDVLHYLADWSAQTGNWYDCLELSRFLDGSLSLQGRWGQWQQVLEQSLQAAQQTGNQAAEAWSLHQLGTQALAEGNTTQAEAALTQALQLRKALGDQAGAAITRHNLGLLVPPLVAPETTPIAKGSSGIAAKTALLVAAGGTALVAGIAAFLLWPAGTSDQPIDFSLSAQAMEFGERQLNTSSDPQVLTVSNTGDSPVPIDRMVLRGDRDFNIEEDNCTASFELAPAETCQISVIFTPNGIGRRSATMELQLNGQNHAIPLMGAGTTEAVPSINIIPASAVFNEVQVGDRTQTTLTITNDGTAPLTINALTIAGEHESDFELGANTCSEATLNPDANCTLALIFNPSENGERLATLTIDNNAAPETFLEMSGLGTQTPTPPKPIDDSATTQANTPVKINVLSNDDPVSGKLTIVNVTTPQVGQVDVNEDNTLTYRPNSEATDEARVDRFTYKVRNGQNITAEATVTVTIEPATPVPVAKADRAETEAGQAVTISVLSNDSGEDLTVATVESTTQFGGTIEQNNDGTLTYRPASNFSGVDLFSYTNRDRNGTISEPANVEVLVNAAPPPVAVDDQATTEQDTSVTIPVLVNDQGDDIVFANVESRTLQNGVVQTSGDQTVVYTPPEGFSGEDRFSYIIRDRNGTVSERAVVTVQVNRVNALPITIDDEAYYNVSSSEHFVEVALNVLANDRDPDGNNADLRIESVTSGKFTKTRISDDGRSILYTQVLPPVSYLEREEGEEEEYFADDSFTYTIRDADGAVSQSATVEIEVFYAPSRLPPSADTPS